MNLSQFVLILKSRWRLIGSLALAGLVLAALAVLLLPRSYAADAEVLVNVRSPVTVTMTGDAGVTPQIQPDYLATQVDVIKSDRVAAAAVKRLRLTEDVEAMRGYRESGVTVPPEVYFASRLGAGLKVVPATSSRVISIVYSSRSAQSAASIANAYAAAYRDVSVELQREPEQQAADWYSQSAAALSAKLAEAQRHLSTRRAELNVTALPDGTDAEDARLSALSQQLATAQGLQAAQGARAAGGALPDAMASPVVQGLQSDLARLEAQRRQLATFAGPNNVDYRQVVSQIAALQAELGRQRALVSQSASTSSAQSSAGVARLQGDVAAQRGRVIASQRARGEIAALEQDVQNLKNTYEQLVAKQSQSTLLGESNQTNVLLLSPAAVPTKPAGLPWPLAIALGLVMGLSLGVVSALAVEFLDQRMRTPEDAAVWLEIPNLGGVRALDGPGPGLLGYVPQRYLPRPERDI